MKMANKHIIPLGALIAILLSGASMASEMPGAKEAAPLAASAPGNQSVATMAISDSELRLRIDYAHLLVNGSAASRINASNNPEAKSLLKSAGHNLDKAKDAFDAKDFALARTSADSALRDFNAAARIVPSENMMKEQRNFYEEHHKVLDDLIETHNFAVKKTVKDHDAAAAVHFDEKRVKELDQEAISLANQERYAEAINRLDLAQEIVLTATENMLRSHSITYSIDIDTPEKEYAYETQRYHGYEELVPIALELKNPDATQRRMVERSADQGRSIYAKAKAKAANGDYPSAIRLMMEATDEMRRALYYAGTDQ